MSELENHAATLQGFATHWARGESFPLIFAREGASCVGLVVACPDAVLERLDFYEGVFGYTRGPVAEMGDTDGSPTSVYFPPEGNTHAPGDAWSLEDWVARWGVISVEAAGEVMASLGREAPGQLAARFGSIRARAQSRLSAARAERGTLRKGGTRASVELLGEEVLSNDFFRVRALTLRHPTFEGPMTPPLRREVFDAIDAVTVLPYDPVRDRVLLIEQFRVANYARGDAWPWSIEVVAGRCDPGETCEEAARRETLEEGGVTLSALHPVGSYYPSTGALTEYLFAFIGIADLPEELGGVAGLADEGEDIRVFTLPFEAAMDRLDACEFENATVMISLLQLARMRPALRQAAGIT